MQLHYVGRSLLGGMIRRLFPVAVECDEADLAVNRQCQGEGCGVVAYKEDKGETFKR